MTPVPSQSTTPATASPLVNGSPAFDPDYEVEAGSAVLHLSAIFFNCLDYQNTKS